MKSFSGSTVVIPPSGYCRRKSRRAKILLFIAILFLSPDIYAFHNYFLPSPEQDLNWQLDKTVNGVEFFYALSSCSGSNAVFLKLNNKNKYAVEVSWKEGFQTQIEKDAEGKGDKKIVIQPGETFETNCFNPVHKELVVLASKAVPTYVAIISKFNYKDVTVTNAN